MPSIIRLVRLPIILVCFAVSACSSFTNDPSARTPGTVIDDQFIESIASREVNKADPLLKAGNVDVVSFNGVVLLTGQVQNQALADKAASAVENIRKVRSVHNELKVGGPTSGLSRTNDTWLSTKVKTKLIADDTVDSDKIKVVTENGVVYLLGLVPRQEADQAVNVARNVFGVQKVVKVFEYLE